MHNNSPLRPRPNPKPWSPCCITTIPQSKYILKRSKLDKNVFYLKTKSDKPKKYMKPQKLFSVTDEKDKFADEKTQASVKNSFSNNEHEPVTREEFDFDAYIGNMRSCISSQHRTVVARKVEEEEAKEQIAETTRMLRRTTIKDSIPSISKKHIKKNCPIAKIQQSLFWDQPLYQSTQSCSQHPIPYDFIQDQRFTLFKLNTLFFDYLQLPCVYRHGKLFSLTPNNELQSKFTLQQLDQHLTRNTSILQPIYTKITKYNLTSHEEFVVPIPIIYANMREMYNSMYYFVEVVRGKQELKQEQMGKRVWVRDRKGRVAYATVGALVEGAKQQGVEEVRREVQNNSGRKKSLQCGLSRFVCN